MEQPKPCILVADDSRVVRKAANGILAADYRVIEASNGSEALSKLAATTDVQAVFLDLWMPDIDGFEVLKTLRKSAEVRLRELPVIIITGDSEDEKVRDRALALGASDFISKPFSGAQLLESLETFLPKANVVAAVAEIETGRGLDAADIQATQQIDGRMVAQQRRLIRRDQLLADGNTLLQRCDEEKRPLALLKIRLERVGALYHKTGESVARDVLRQIGQTISFESRRKDLLMRLSLTDFAVVMPSTGKLEAKEFALRVFRAVRQHVIEHEGARFHLTLSGSLIAPQLRPGLDFEQILELAETRLERATADGGNRLVASDMEHPTIELERRISLDDASLNLKQGEMATVDSNLLPLLKKLFPLLVFANARLRLGIDDALKKLYACVRTEP